MAKKYERFIKTYSVGGGGTAAGHWPPRGKILQTSEIWVDKETGVNYLFHSNSVGAGLTVLVDREGRPIITTVFPDEE